MRIRSGGADYRVAALLTLAISLATGAAQAQLPGTSGSGKSHRKSAVSLLSPLPAYSPHGHRKPSVTTHSSSAQTFFFHRDGSVATRRSAGFKTTVYDGNGHSLSISSRSITSSFPKVYASPSKSPSLLFPPIKKEALTVKPISPATPQLVVPAPYTPLPPAVPAVPAPAASSRNPSSAAPLPPAAPADAPVWVNPKSHIYYSPGSRWYGRTKEGYYMSEQDALTAGNRPTLQH